MVIRRKQAIPKERAKPSKGWKSHEPPKCAGKLCRDQTPVSGGKTVQCSAIKCSSDEWCKRKSSAQKCKYCVDGRCSVQKSMKQNDETPRSHEEEQKLQKPKLTRFTRVARPFRWTQGRPTQTLLPGFGQCYLKKCRNGGTCRRNGRRKKRSGDLFSCIRCRKRQCTPQMRRADRHKPDIRHDETIGEFFIPLRYPVRNKSVDYIGYLKYSQDHTDPSTIHINWIEANPTYRGRKVGRGLLEYFVEDFLKNKRNDVKTVTLTLNDINNSPAKTLYQHVGFKFDDPTIEQLGMTLNVKKYGRYPKGYKDPNEFEDGGA